MSTKQTSELEGSYLLPRNLEISAIEKVYQDVLGFMSNTYEKFVLDAGEVALVDTAGIQFLILLIRSLKAKGCEVCWANDSIQIYQMAAELGLEDEFED